METTRLSVSVSTFALACAGLFVGGCGSLHTWATERRYPAESQRLVVDGTSLSYRALGNGKPVVLLHGSPGSYHDFPESLVQALSKTFRVVVVELPGHGYSERGPKASPINQAKLVHGLLEELNEQDRPIIVGYSWGSVIALVYTIEYQEKTAGLVLVGPVAYPDANLVHPERKLVTAPVLGGIVVELLGGPVASIIIRKQLDAGFAPEKPVKDYVQLSSALWARPGELRAIMQDSLATKPTLDHYVARYGELVLPVEILLGECDQYVQPGRHGERLAEEIGSNARITWVREGGHCLPITRPMAVVGAVRNLASRVR